MRHRAIGIAILAALAVCNSGSAESGGKAVVSLQCRPQGGQQARFGEVTDFLFRLTNQSERALVVRSIRPLTDAGEDPIALAGAVYGAIERVPGEDAFRHGEMTQSASRLPLYEGFLLPGEQLEVRRTYRPVAPQEEFAIEYVSADGPYRGSATSLRPLAPYLSEKESPMAVIYRPFEEERWKKIAAENPQIGEVGAGASPRAVLLPELPAAGLTTRVFARIPLVGATFPAGAARKAAARIAGAPAGALKLGYSRALGGYVVAERDAFWLLRSAAQRERGPRLPSFPFSFLRDADSEKAVRVQVGQRQEGGGSQPRPAHRKLWGIYPVAYGDGMYTRGEFIQVPRAELPSFLARVRAHGGKLSEQRYFFRSRYFVLHLPGTA